MRIQGERAHASLVVCTGREHDNQKERNAQVVLQRRGAPTKRTTVKEWTDGWEWGGSARLLGALVANAGSNDAVVIDFSSYDTDTSRTTTLIYSFAQDWNLKSGQSGSHLRAELAKDGSALTVSQCEFREGVSQEPGLECTSATGNVSAFQLRWDGRAVQRSGR